MREAEIIGGPGGKLGTQVKIFPNKLRLEAISCCFEKDGERQTCQFITCARSVTLDGAFLLVP